MKKLIVLLSLTFLLTSCGGGGSGSSAPKDLFSLWNEAGTNNPLDLTGSTFSSPVPFSFFFVGGEQCNCNLTVLGTQSSGSYVVNSCVYQAGSGASDPGCNALNDTGTYTNSSDTLTITSSTATVSVYN